MNVIFGSKWQKLSKVTLKQVSWVLRLNWDETMVN